MEFLAGLETKEARGRKDLRVLLGQWELKGVLEDLDSWGKKENLAYLEILGQWGKLDSEENREIMASQAMVT